MSLEITLQNAISGLQTSKQSLQVISNNIANANTEGYTRKVIQQTSRTIDGQGYGVQLAKLTRNVDDGVLRQLRTENGNVARLTTKQAFLEQVNSLFGKPEDNDSIAHEMADLGSQFDSLAVSPETESNQYLTVQSATAVTSKLENMSDQVQRMRSDANLQIQGQLKTFNDQMDLVVSLNSKIIQFNASNVSTAELEDQRDQALSAMSQVMDIKYFEKSDGSMTVYTAGGQTLIDGQAQHLSYNRPSALSPTLEYTPTSAVNYIIPGQPGYPVGGIPGIFVGDQIASQDITSSIGSGSLKGLLDIRDNELPSLQSQIDELSEKFKDTVNTVHNSGAGFPPVVGMTGDRYVNSNTTLDASGSVRIGVVDASGNLVNDQVLDLSGISTVGDLVTKLNTIPNISASLNANGQLSIAAGNNNRIAINEMNSNVSAAGDLDKGFSDFFGLNNFYTSSESFATYRSDLATTASSGAVTTAGTLQFTAAGVNTTVNYSANSSLNSLASAINGNSALQTAGITAQVVADGAGFRLQVSDTDGDPYAMVETGGGSALNDLDLRADNRGLSNRLSVRQDIQDNTFYMSRGTLESNTFNSTLTGVTDQTAALGATKVGALTFQLEGVPPTFSSTLTGVTDQTVPATAAGSGALSFTLDGGATTSVNYDGSTDSLDDIAAALNANTTLSSHGITAEVVTSGTEHTIKLSDAQGDNFQVGDTGSLGVKGDPTITYDGATDSLDSIVTKINSNSTLAAQGITAQVVTTGTEHTIKISSAQSDNFWISDTNGSLPGSLGVSTNQGVSVGDGTVAAAMADAFNEPVQFLASPASGGGLSASNASFTDYAASILSFQAAQTSTVQTEATYQQNLADELYSKNASISGVNMDEELSNLIVYEQAYLASARMITTTQELFKALTDMVSG